MQADDHRNALTEYIKMAVHQPGLKLKKEYKHGYLEIK